jgi:hypothetical protein
MSHNLLVPNEKLLSLILVSYVNHLHLESILFSTDLHWNERNIRRQERFTPIFL